MPTFATKKIQIDVNWGALTGHSGIPAVTHVAFYDAATAGNFKCCVAVTATLNIASGTSVDFPANSIYIREVGSATAVIANPLALAILDAVYGATTLGPTNFYLALMTTPPASDGTGGVEFPATGNYARKLVANNGTSFSAAAMV